MTDKRTPHPHNRETFDIRPDRLLLLVLLVKELPVAWLAHDGPGGSTIEFAHLMKSASSLLEALMGGVATVPAAGLAEGPEVAYLTPPKRVANQAMAIYCFGSVFPVLGLLAVDAIARKRT